MDRSLFVRHAKQIVQVCARSERQLRGKAMNELAVLTASSDDAQGVSLVVAEDGSISDIGRDVELIAKYGDHRFGREIDATDCCVLPGNLGTPPCRLPQHPCARICRRSHAPRMGRRPRARVRAQSKRKKAVRSRGN